MGNQENANHENTSQEVIFELDSELVFETALATLQLSHSP